METPSPQRLASDSVAGEERPASCRRAYFRVETRLPLRVTWVPAEQLEALEQEIRGPRDGSLEILDPGLAKQLQQIEAKLDMVLAQLGHEIVKPLGRSDSREVSLSGSGIRIQTRETFRSDDHVLIEALLPGTPPHAIRAVGRIVSDAERRSLLPVREVAMVFTAISEDDREAVIRHAYEVQRLSLRSRATQSAPPPSGG